MNLLEKVIDQDVCAGCGLCASVSNNIKMTVSDVGFLRPDFKINEITEESLRIINNTCPGMTVKHDLDYDVADSFDKIWGPYFNINSGFSSEDKVRYNGSSGGVLTALAIYLLEAKKVDCIIHVGQSTKRPYINETKISFDKGQVLSNSGSRYAPSSPLEVINEIVSRNLTCAIIAKPCDISAVRRYITLESKLKSNIKYLMSFMCAGVPSLKGTEIAIDSLGVNLEDVKDLKYRGEGWPGYFKVTKHNKEIHKMTYNESWGTILNKHLQFRCKICVDGTGEFADITCADAWEESEDGYPSFEEKEGLSLIIERTSKGVNLMKEAVENGYIIKKNSLVVRDIDKIQPYQVTRKKNILSRKIALKALGYNLPNYNLRSLFLLTIKQNPQKTAKNFTGMFLRKIKQKGHA